MAGKQNGVDNFSFDPVAEDGLDGRRPVGQYQTRDDELLDPPEKNITCDYICCKWGCLQHFRSPKIVVALISLVVFSQITVSVGFSSATITTLERRFRLSSSESGIILSLYEVGSILCCLPISYFLTNSRRLRAVSVTVIVMGLGSFLYALPHFVAGYYVYDTPVPPKCYLNGTAPYPDFCANKKSDMQLNQYKWVFMASQLIMGAASPAALTLAIPYLDDSLMPHKAPFYLGFVYTSIVLGSASGFLAGGVFMRIYVDIGRPHPGLTMANTKQWVGAWWIGFLMIGTVLILTSIPLFGFPKQLPGTAKIMRKRKSEAYGTSEKTAKNQKVNLKDFGKNMKLLMTNATFMLLVLASALDQVKKTGFTSFGTKYFESNFKLSTAEASITFGVLLICGAGSGIFIGGIIVRVANLSMRGMLRYIVIINLISLPLEFQLFIPCGPAKPNMPDTSLQHANISCNTGCDCRMDSIMFEPSCGRNGLNYYSPCFAGCKASTGRSYVNCSCIPYVANTTKPEMRRGECTDKCEYLKLFLATAFIGAFVNTLAMTSYITAVMRCVPLSLKPTALGINTILSKIVGAIPGPIVVGAIMDSACTLWTSRCNVRGNCAHYDLFKMRLNFFCVNIVTSVISIGMQIAAMCVYRTGSEEEDKGSNDNEKEMYVQKGMYPELQEPEKQNSRL